MLNTIEKSDTHYLIQKFPQLNEKGIKHVQSQANLIECDIRSNTIYMNQHGDWFNYTDEELENFIDLALFDYYDSIMTAIKEGFWEGYFGQYLK